MKDTLLLDAIERYLSGNMLPEEKAYFEQIRKNTPEIDQMVVEHKLFLHQMAAFSERISFKHALHEAHSNLINKGSIYEGGEITTKEKVVQLWNKYRRITGIAASIAGITALVISGLIAMVTPSVNQSQLQQLNKKIDIVQRNQQVQGAKLIEVDSKIPSGSTVTTGGSAFLIDGKGYLITNAHVLKGSGAVVVNNSGREFNARIVNIDNQKDLAILKIEDEDFQPFASLPYSFRKSSVELGEELYTLGYPRDEIVFNMGYLSAASGFNSDTASFQLSLSANPGNSGGPVINKNGEIIGIISTRQTQAEGVVFAIKTSGIYKLIDELQDADTTLQKIRLSNNSSLKGMSRVDQVKEVEEYVFQVKAYNEK